MIAEKKQEGGIPQLLNIKQVATILNVNPKSLYNQHSAGTLRIKAKRIGNKRGLIRFDLRDVQSYIDSL
ncbi:MAG: helix-turn-helix domain-containing protein [Desulfatiglans sp.]|nr:helix-turn-helix domain-containing protein [Desulfatiglans sp.]